MHCENPDRTEDPLYRCRFIQHKSFTHHACIHVQCVCGIAFNPHHGLTQLPTLETAIASAVWQFPRASLRKLANLIMCHSLHWAHSSPHASHQCQWGPIIVRSVCSICSLWPHHPPSLTFSLSLSLSLSLFRSLSPTTTSS